MTHTYKTPGTYTAKVTVTDAGGLDGTATITVVITARTKAARPGRAPCSP